MWHGLEGWEPLVDHHLAEFAAKLPFSHKFDGKATKRILKDIVHRYVPAETIQRPKAGFSLPINAWLRGEVIAGPLSYQCCVAYRSNIGF